MTIEPLFDPIPDPQSSHQQSVAADWVRQYVLDELPEPERERFEEHFFECSACSDRVRTAYLLLRGVEATLQRDLIRPDCGLERAAAGARSPRRKSLRQSGERASLH